MADKLTELKQALEGMPDEGLRIVLEFSRYLIKKQSQENTSQQDRETQPTRASQKY